MASWMVPERCDMVDEGSVCYYSCLLESIHSFGNLHIDIALIVDYVHQVILVDDIMGYSFYVELHVLWIWEIIDEYNLLNIVENQGYVYVKIVKGIYGLKQSGIIAHRALIHHIVPSDNIQLAIPQAYGNMRPETPYLPSSWMTLPSNTHPSTMHSTSSMH